MPEPLRIQVGHDPDDDLAMQMFSVCTSDQSMMTDLLIGVAWARKGEGVASPKTQEDVAERVDFYINLNQAEQARVDEEARYLLVVVLRHLTKHVVDTRKVEPNRILSLGDVKGQA